MNGWDDINIKIEYFPYIYCLSSETLILTVDKFYDHLWQSYMSRLTFLSFGGDENPFVYLWPLHLFILCTYWVNVRMWEYLCPTKYLNTWPLSPPPGHLLPLPSQRGRARVQQTRRRWDQPASAMAAKSAEVLVTGVLQSWHQYWDEYTRKTTSF